MKVIKVLLIYWMLLLKETRSLEDSLPTETPCAADVDSQRTCNHTQPETTETINFSDVITNSDSGNTTVSSSNKELTEELPKDDKLKKNMVSVKAANENETKPQPLQDTIKTAPTQEISLPTGNARNNEGKSHTPLLHSTESITLNTGTVTDNKNEHENLRKETLQLNNSTKTTIDDFVHIKALWSNETSNNSTTHADNQDSHSQVLDAFSETQKENYSRGIEDQNDKLLNVSLNSNITFEEQTQGNSSSEQLKNATAKEDFSDGNTKADDTTITPNTDDVGTSIHSSTTNFTNDGGEHINGNLSLENSARSLENGDLTKNELLKITNQQSRADNVVKEVNNNSSDGGKISLDNATAIVENITDHLHNEKVMEENLSEKNLHDADSKMYNNSTLVRKCCEEHQFFSLETQSCQDVDMDLAFKSYVQEILLNSPESFQISSGLLRSCPGSNEPPLVAEARFDTHSLAAIGHLRDKSYDTIYDHDHYCLELASHPANLPNATLVLAHCFPYDKSSSEILNFKTSVRKCCEEQEYFSVSSQQCEPAGRDTGITDSIRTLLTAEASDTLEYVTGTLKACPRSGAAPSVEEAYSHSHSLLPVGHIQNHNSASIFDHDHYCLEYASLDELTNPQLVLAYCPPALKEEYRTSPNETVVRKCCGSQEYFSLRTQQCEATEIETGFVDYLNGIKVDDSLNSLKYIHGKVEWCPNSGDLPQVTAASSDTHTLLVFGSLRELKTGITYDHDNYCLEIAAQSPEEFSEASLVAAYCPASSIHIFTRKCCNLNQYYDSVASGCFDRNENMTNYNFLVHEFLRDDPTASSTSIRVGDIRCYTGPPKTVYAHETYLDKSGQLCEHRTGICHPHSAYCIEHFLTEGDNSLKAGAFVCPTDFFYKCCQHNEILTDGGCQKNEFHYVQSSHIRQLMEIMEPHIGFHSQGDKQICDARQISSEDVGLRWWVNRAGYLSITSKHGEDTITQYCVEDFVDRENTTHFIAQMCLRDLEHHAPVELIAQSGELSSVGKCCHQGDNLHIYENQFQCIGDNSGLDIATEPQLKDNNITEVVFTHFPTCSFAQGLHKYPLGEHIVDYAVFGESQVLEIINLQYGCYISKQTVRRNDFCLDYLVEENNIQPIVVVCTGLWQGFRKYQEKYSLTAVLLGISCTALMATAFSLISMRVRRGLVTVKKVNTLAGRILLSYVLSYLIAYLLLAIGMKQSIQEGPSCSVLAGFLMFFLLAAFQWNTSICLESLLLTLRVSVSEHRRYLCHSLWAWGVPGLITTIALTLDHHKESLPCSTIIPRIGLYRCFFSDRNAQLLYLYMPMFMSLLANMCLLSAARYVRSAKLRRLEKGGRNRTNTKNDAMEVQDQQSKTSDQNTSQVSHQSNAQHSGLRTHQTRNLWTESMKLVVWSGATWMLEVASFLLTRFVDLSESWYNYLWYLPSSVNSLRGVGIFIILVLTPENRQKISKVVGKLGSRTGSESMARHSRSVDAHSSSGNHQSSIPQGRSVDSRQHGRRNMSIATTLTSVSHLSSIRSEVSGDPRSDTGSARCHPRLAQSVSQIDSRRGSASSQSSEGECSEAETDFGGGGRRKTSLANFGLVSLPSVDEEEIFDGTSTTAIVQPSQVDNTESTSYV